MSAPPPSKLDGLQVLKASFDDAKGRIRVDADITAQDITVEVELDAATDSVRVEDPDTGAHIRVEANGSINVNSEIDANDGDNIAISDGINTLDVNPDGSINVKTTNPVYIFTLPFDSITASYPSATQEIYQSRTGGVSGTIIETITVNYTDSTKNFILNLART